MVEFILKKNFDKEFGEFKILFGDIFDKKNSFATNHISHKKH